MPGQAKKGNTPEQEFENWYTWDQWEKEFPREEGRNIATKEALEAQDNLVFWIRGEKMLRKDIDDEDFGQAVMMRPLLSPHQAHLYKLYAAQRKG